MDILGHGINGYDLINFSFSSRRFLVAYFIDGLYIHTHLFTVQ